MATDDRWESENPYRARPAAAGRVALPGLFLILLGALGAAVEVGGVALAVAAPTLIRDQYKAVIDAQPPGPQKQQMEKQFREQEADLRMDKPSSYAWSAFGLVLNLLMVVGGGKMRSRSGYGLGVAGSVAALIPCSGCLCFTLPVGAWALVVLLNPDVKRAFGVGSPPPADDLDDRSPGSANA